MACGENREQTGESRTRLWAAGLGFRTLPVPQSHSRYWGSSRPTSRLDHCLWLGGLFQVCFKAPQVVPVGTLDNKKGKMVQSSFLWNLDFQIPSDSWLPELTHISPVLIR